MHAQSSNTRRIVLRPPSRLSFWAFGQSQIDLATTRDCSVLYLSQVPASGSDTKIYRWSPGTGLALFGDRPDLGGQRRLYGTQTTYTDTVLFHAGRACSSGTGPGFNNCTIGETQIVIPGLASFSVPGFLLISPTGRYGVFASFETGATWVDWFTGQEVNVDFRGRHIPNVSPPFIVNQHAIANNGSLLIEAVADGQNGMRVWSPKGEIALPVTDIIQYAAISADGSTVAITARDPLVPGPTAPTIVHDLASGRRTRFAQRLSMSGDGQTVAYLSADPFQPAQERPQAMIARSDGTEVRQLTNAPEGIRSAILSGDARYLYVVANGQPSQPASRIRRIEVASRAADDVPAPENP